MTKHKEQGNAFKALLKAHKMTYADFARKIDMAPQCVQYWAYGYGAPFKMNTIEKLRTSLSADFFAQVAEIYPFIKVSKQERIAKSGITPEKQHARYMRRRYGIKTAALQKAPKSIKAIKQAQTPESRKEAAARFEAECRARIRARYGIKE